MTLVSVSLGRTDTDSTTCLHVPSIRLAVCGDALYNDVHLHLGESDAVPRPRSNSMARCLRFIPNA